MKQKISNLEKEIYIRLCGWQQCICEDGTIKWYKSIYEFLKDLDYAYEYETNNYFSSIRQSGVRQAYFWRYCAFNY